MTGTLLRAHLVTLPVSATQFPEPRTFFPPVLPKPGAWLTRGLQSPPGAAGSLSGVREACCPRDAERLRMGLPGRNPRPGSVGEGICDACPSRVPCGSARGPG